MKLEEVEEDLKMGVLQIINALRGMKKATIVVIEFMHVEIMMNIRFKKVMVEPL